MAQSKHDSILVKKPKYDILQLHIVNTLKGLISLIGLVSFDTNDFLPKHKKIKNKQ